MEEVEVVRPEVEVLAVRIGHQDIDRPQDRVPDRDARSLLAPTPGDPMVETRQVRPLRPVEL